MATLVKWDPSRNAFMLQDRINRMFSDAFPIAPVREDQGIKNSWKPVVDIYDTPPSVFVEVELPGINKEDVSVDVKGNVLTIKGRKTTGREIKEEQYYRREREDGAFYRAFTLPLEIDPDTITAKFKEGLLEIEIPKPSHDSPRPVRVTVK